MDFDLAFERLLGHEGELSLDPKDRGNWTSGVVGEGELKGSKYGVSAMSYPNLDIASLTKEDCKAIYREDFWSRVRGEDLPDGVAFQAFDFAVNSAPETAVRYLQRALGVADDGMWGPVTQAAVRTIGVGGVTESDVIMLLNSERLDYMSRLSTWAHNGRGWARRIAKNLRYGAEDS